MGQPTELFHEIHELCFHTCTSCHVISGASANEVWGFSAFAWGAAFSSYGAEANEFWRLHARSFGWSSSASPRIYAFAGEDSTNYARPSPSLFWAIYGTTSQRQLDPAPRTAEGWIFDTDCTMSSAGSSYATAATVSCTVTVTVTHNSDNEATTGAIDGAIAPCIDATHSSKHNIGSNVSSFPATPLRHIAGPVQNRTRMALSPR